MKVISIYGSALAGVAMIMFSIKPAQAQDLREAGKSFQRHTIDSSVAIGYGIATGDVDGDGKTDILLADKKQFVWYRNGDWKRFVMAENLTQHDNVCIAATDVDGDGRVEVAVGAQWNPGETNDPNQSGAVFFLERPADPTDRWMARPLYHEPTVHRMRWLKSADETFYLLVLPLHGQANKDGSGTPVNLLLYKYPDLLSKKTPAIAVNTGMHLTHNLDIVTPGKAKEKGVLIGGKEGIAFLDWNVQQGIQVKPFTLTGSRGAGEVRSLRVSRNRSNLAAIESMHGNSLVIYNENGDRQVLDSSFAEGHALVAADLLGRGYDQLIAGWRRPNQTGRVGVKIFFRKDPESANWESTWLDDNAMACEDLQVADLDADGKLDIIAAGRNTRNLVIYWNRLQSK